MQKKRAKKSWRIKNDKHRCTCYYCEGAWEERLIKRTRSRKKYQKHRNLIWLV